MGTIPFIAGAVRQALLADAAFAAACGGRLATKVGNTFPCSTVRVTDSSPISGDNIAYKPFVQVEGWCPESTQDAEILVWRIASEAARVLGRLRNVSYENMTYSGRLAGGPIPDVDTSRGTGSPLCRAFVHIELTAHVL
jgi:hypothetical protein